MTTQISSNNIQPATLAVISPVTITSITVTNSSWTPLDDSAVSTSGGFVVITGTNFATGCNVIIGSTNATSVSFVNSTTLRVQVPALSAGTYVVYVTNTNGTTAIIVNGLTYSGTPTWVTASPLPQGTTGVAISIQLSATGDTPLTYALQAGSSLPAGLTLSSGGLLSGTVTGLTSETTYNFTIEAIDPQLQDSPKAFAITILAGDQLWDYVTLLLPGTTSTSIFNDDASTNNFPISIFGDTRPNNSNPYTPGYYSNLFDGTSTSLTVPVTAASGNLTIECWIYPTAFTSPRGFIVSSGGNDATAWALSYNTNGAIGLWLGSYGGAAVNSTSTIPLNTWGHIAIVKTSGTVFLYVNGVQVTPSVTQAGVFGSATNASIATYNAGINTQSFAGYISNFRYVIGTAIYTANFTPPTAPLTAVAGTSLLICQSNRFIDNSPNNVTITRNGNVTVNSFDPFVPSSSTATLGSTYFDGTGDYLSVPDNEAFNYTGDFTIECWLYPTSHPAIVYLIGQTSSTDYAPVLIALNSGRPALAVSSNGSTWTINGSIATALTLNTWSHVATVRNGNKWSIYVNGVENVIAASTAVTPYNSTDPLGIGGEAVATINYPYVGYISNLRIVKGTAVYTTAFTPPTAPLTAIANTSLLTCQTNQPVENNDFLDSSTNNFLVTRNGNTTQGTFSPYAENWSNFFNGSTGYLAIPNNAAFAFGAGSLTVEAWIYTGVRTDFQSVIGTFDGGSNAWYIHTNASGTITYGLSANSPYVASVQVCDNIWHHVAMVRNGASDLRLYVDGVLADSRTDSSQPTPAAEIRIGSLSSGFTRYFNGYISNARVVKGTAVYTSNFTPSITPLQPIPNTSLLTCRDSSFVDDSANRFTVTSNGNASVQKFGPFAGTTLPTPYYGAYFDGSGDYLTFPNSSAFTFGTGDFTIEAWVNLRSTSSRSDLIGAAATGSFDIQLTVPTNLISFGRTNTAYDFQTTYAFVVGQWTHVAIARASGTIRCFVNGVLLNSAANTINYSQSGGTGSIGAANATEHFLNGYISNLRVVKGQALYTTTFTPSTTPLTTTSQGATASNVSLLTCQSATFIDNSTNNFAITAVGNSQPTFFNPFTITYSTLQSYSPSVFGGSMYFDGTGDFLTVPDNTTLQMSTGDFTIEFWINFSSIAGYQTPYDKGYTNAGGLLFQSGNGNGRMIIYAAGTAVITESGTGSVGEWIHYALVRRGTTLTLYRNGTSSGTATNSTNFNNSSQLGIGANGVAPAGGSIGMYAINGYLSNVRVVKGTAIYTSNFVPSNQPLTAVQNSVLLLNGTAGGIIDVSSGNNLETVGDARLSVVQTKWPSTSMFFDGTGDRLIVPSSPNFDFPANFTIEMWLNLSNVLGDWQAIISRAYAVAGGWRLYKTELTNQLRWYVGSLNPVATTTGHLTNNTWSHVAVVRNGSTVTIYIDGVNRGSATETTNLSPGNYALEIGEGVVTSAYPMTGYIQDLRITNGIARYTANFTPPTGPFLTN